MLNKKKAFIGVPAPLGYVPGLGRGYVYVLYVLLVVFSYHFFAQSLTEEFLFQFQKI